jgi:integrase
MTTVDQYINAATRNSTRKSYQSAVEHFEVQWGGFLPATADSIARYLADYAGLLAINTLKQRLAAIAQWHIDQGMPDPTKAPLVKKVFRGIRAIHPAQQKQAKPFPLEQLEQLDDWLSEQISTASADGNQAALLKHLRDHALVLLGFWRGFRSDELSRLEIENINLVPGEGMTLFLPFSKTDRNHQGQTFKAPALSRLCPVTAYQQWIDASQLTTGPVFRSINRWGYISRDAIHPTSFIQLLRDLFARAAISTPESYSSHSLRRGFATWATASGWDLKTLMNYVGWKDMRSAMRYIDSPDPFEQHRINITLELANQSAPDFG